MTELVIQGSVEVPISVHRDPLGPAFNRLSQPLNALRGRQSVSVLVHILDALPGIGLSLA